MTRATYPTDEQLLELLRRTDPLTGSRPSAGVETDTNGLERDRLLQRILATKRDGPNVKRARRKRPLILGVASGGRPGRSSRCGRPRIHGW